MAPTGPALTGMMASHASEWRPGFAGIRSELEFEQNAIRRLMLDLLANKRSLKMDVASFPVDENALRAQTDLQKTLGDALAGKGALTVQVKSDPSPS